MDLEERLGEWLSDEEIMTALTIRSKPTTFLNHHPELQGRRTVRQFVAVILWHSSYSSEVVANALVRVGVTGDYQAAKALGKIGSRTRRYINGHEEISVSLLDERKALSTAGIGDLRSMYGKEVNKGDLMAYVLRPHP